MLDSSTLRSITGFLDTENNEDPSVERRNLLEFFKMSSTGTKVIRIEIYDAAQFTTANLSSCSCNARVCTQHVVKDEATDNIYHRVKDLIKCIENNFYTSQR